MSITHDDLHSLANDLIVGKTEAHWRSAISRGYYAALHGCKLWHKNLPAPGSAAGYAGGEHQVLINQLFNPARELNSDLKLKSRLLSSQLSSLRTMRCKADYDIHLHVDEASAKNVCQDVKKLLEAISQP